jgi:hypothetical protein
MKLTFVETGAFTARWKRRLDDQALRALQLALLDNVFAGDPIPGCGLLRKVRLADPSRGKGKRGGLRIIYMHTPEAARVDLLTVYGKDEKDDLSKGELIELCQFARMLRSQIIGESRMRIGDHKELT